MFVGDDLIYVGDEDALGFLAGVEYKIIARRKPPMDCSVYFVLTGGGLKGNNTYDSGYLRKNFVNRSNVSRKDWFYIKMTGKRPG